MTGNNLKDTINIGNSIPHNTGVNMNPLKNYTPVVFSDNTDDLIEDVANMTSNNIGNSIIQNSNFSQSQMQQPQQISLELKSNHHSLKPQMLQMKIQNKSQFNVHRMIAVV